LVVFLLFCQDHPSLSSLPPFFKEGPLPKESAPEDTEAPEAVERRDGGDVKDSVEGTDSNQSPPSANALRGFKILGYIKVARCAS
jgi:hypothetical protein